MQTESEGPNALHDFVRHNGAPIGIRRDQSKMQQSNRWTNWMRKYVIADQWSEAYMQQQNPAEASIRILKHQLEVLLSRTGAPDEAWLLALEYIYAGSITRQHQRCWDGKHLGR